MPQLTPEQLQGINTARNTLGAAPIQQGQLANTGLPAPQQTTPEPQLPQPTQAAQQTQQFTQGTPQQTGAEAQQAAQTGQLVFDPNVNPSVVDLLNTAGVDSSYQARQQMAQQYGIQGYTGTAAQNQELAQRFTDAFNQQQGKPVPQTAAEARGALDDFFAGQQPQQEVNPEQAFFDALAGMNPIERSFFDQLNQLVSTQNTQQSFSEIYTQEVANQGIPGLQMELADINRIMEGSEDDIRSEVEATGGFATESQVRALTGARNKTLMREANYISNMLSAKNDYVDTIVRLTQADREQVDKDLDRKLGISEMMMTTYNRSVDAARENYQKLVDNVGFDGIAEMFQGKPKQLARFEKTMGIPEGTLSNPVALAMFEPTPEWSDPYVLGGNYVQENLHTGEIRTASAIPSSTTTNIFGGAISEVTGKPLSEGERLSQTFAHRMQSSARVIDDVGSQFTGAGAGIAAFLPNFLKSTERQQFEQAKRNFINAQLRKESGAVISPEEFDNADKQYFPQPGDTSETLEQKRENREDAINGMFLSGGLKEQEGTEGDPLGILGE